MHYIRQYGTTQFLFLRKQTELRNCFDAPFGNAALKRQVRTGKRLLRKKTQERKTSSCLFSGPRGILLCWCFIPPRRQKKNLFCSCNSPQQVNKSWNSSAFNFVCRHRRLIKSITWPQCEPFCYFIFIFTSYFYVCSMSIVGGGDYQESTCYFHKEQFPLLRPGFYTISLLLVLGYQTISTEL